jgi:hypothetical protein
VSFFIAALTGCPNPTDPASPPPSVDTSALTTSIATANAAKAGVPVAAEAGEVAQGLHFVTQAELTALETAIEAAQAVKKSPGDQSTVTEAIEALSQAITAFNTAKAGHAGSKTEGFNDGDRTALIQTATSAMSGVETSKDGSNVEPDKIWVTPAIMQAVTDAITALNSTHDDANYLALATALNAFNEAKRNGAKTLEITGLPDALNGSEIQAGLFADREIKGSPIVMSRGTVANGAFRAALYSIVEDGDPVPWNGSGSYYVAFMTENRDLYVTGSPVSFNSSSATVAFSAFEATEMSEEPVEGVGNITGTITFTGFSETRPELRIYGGTNNGSVDGRGSSYAVEANGSFVIPFTQDFLERLQDADQSIYLGLDVGSGNNRFHIELEPITISAGSLSEGNNINVDSLGTVSLASTTLSGIITVNNGGNPVPWVYINAQNAQDFYIGQAFLESPAAGTSWSMTIPVQSGEKVRFSVSGYDSLNNGNQIFHKTLEPANTASVSDQPIGNIALDIGDIAVGRMSGTVSFANMPSPAPHMIYISARYGGNNGPWLNDGQGYTVTVDGTTGTWTIPRDDAFLAALDSGQQTVSFTLYVQPAQDGSGFILASVEKTVSKDGLGSVNLGSASLAYITLSGTFRGSYTGGAIPYVSIRVNTAESPYNTIGNASLRSPVYNAAWTLYAPPQQSPTKVVFAVQGSDSDSSTLFSFNDLSLDNAGTIHNQDISDLTIDIGNVSPNSLKALHYPSGQYTSKLIAQSSYINTSNYLELTPVATGSATGADTVFTASLEDSEYYNVLISAGGVTKYKNFVSFSGDSTGLVDWDAMTEIPAGKTVHK